MKLITEGTGNTVNDVIKALLIGLIAGLIMGLTGENWDFSPHTQAWITERKTWTVQPATIYNFANYGTTQAIITWVIISAMLFLHYNKKN